jgi:hypothetical protein
MYVRWTPEERKTLRELYPTAKQREIIAALKDKTWHMIQ